MVKWQGLEAFCVGLPALENNTAHIMGDAKEDKGATRQNQGLKRKGNLAHCVKFAEICYEYCVCAKEAVCTN